MYVGPQNRVKKTNWADSDDEEEFLAILTSAACNEELERAVVTTNAHAIDPTIELQKKYDRVTELQPALEEQTRCMAELQTRADAAVARIDELEEHNHTQALHVQKLEEGDSSTQVSSHDQSAATKEIATSHPTKPETKDEEERQDTSDQTVQISTKRVVTNKSDVAPAEFLSARPNGPTVNLSAFPVFATPATVKQAAPPPPAPKLKMGVDLSKFAKQSAPKTTILQKKREPASRKVTQDGPVPKIDPSSDIRTKSHEERVLFANSPKVQVKMGDTDLATMPKYVLMQCTSKAFKHFTDDPDATSFTLPADSLDAAAATAHLKWMKEMTYQSRVYSITLHSDEKFDDRNLQICRAARVLGLNNMYVGHFTKVFCDRIRTNTASYEFSSKVVALSYPENDPIYDCLANNLANLRRHHGTEKSAELEAFLQKHTDLKSRVEKIEGRLRKRQDSAKGVKDPRFVLVGRKLVV